MKTTRLIGTEWKCGDTCSGCVLIGRGLFLKDRMIGLIRSHSLVNCLYEVLRAQCYFYVIMKKKCSDDRCTSLLFACIFAGQCATAYEAFFSVFRFCVFFRLFFQHCGQLRVSVAECRHILLTRVLELLKGLRMELSEVLIASGPVPA